jgi:molybdenum cofactor cytidylyltransferase
MIAENRSRIFAIVPAAGRSRRMGCAKQILDVAGRPMLLAVLEPLAAAQVAGVALVTHRAIVAQVELGHLPGVFVVSNEDETSEMIDSVRIGLRAWLARETVADHDGFLVCPGDHPGIATADFGACIAAFRAEPERIVVASREGCRGHPLILPALLADYVKSNACDGGLNALPQAFTKRVIAVECLSSGVATDIDTPEDYLRGR